MCKCRITYCRQNRQDAQTPSVSAAVEWLASDKLSCCLQVLRRWTESNGNSLMPGSCRLSRPCHRNLAGCRRPLAKVLSSNARLGSDCRQGKKHVVVPSVSSVHKLHLKQHDSSNKDSHQSSWSAKQCFRQTKSSN